MSDLQTETDRWHERRLARLQAEDGWLTLVGLFWLEEGDSVAGSAPGSAVLLPRGPAQLGTFTRRGEAVSFRSAPGAGVTLGGQPFAGGPLQTDASDSPDVLRAGPLQLLVIERGGRLAVRARDAEAEARARFPGIERFPVSAGWRKVARWEPAGEGQSIAVPNVLGEVVGTPLAGAAVFEHEGREHRLLATRDDGNLFFVFGDITNRAETYGAGRFLTAPAPEAGQVVLDFNRAVNPPCAFSPYATCPLPPPGNRLALRVEAGERRFGDHD